MTNRPLVTTLALASFIGILGQFMFTPLLPVVAADIDTTVPLLGQTVTAGFLLGALLGLFIGPMGDHYGHRRLILVGIALIVVSSFATAVAIDYWTVLIARLPSAVGGGIIASTAVVLAGTRFPPDEKRAAIGWVVTGIAVAPVVGIPAIVFIGEPLGWRASFVAFGLLTLVCLGLVLRVISVDRAFAGDRFHISDILFAYIPLLHHYSSRALQISNLLRAVGWGAAITYVSAYLVDIHGLSLQGVGYMFIVTGLGYFLGIRLGTGQVGPIGIQTLCAISTALMGASFAIVFIFPIDFWITVPLLSIAAATGGSGFVTLTILISEETPAGQSTTMMLRQSGFALGLAGGGAFGGLFLATGGFALLAMGILVFSLSSALFAYWPKHAAIAAPQPATPET